MGSLRRCWRGRGDFSRLYRMSRKAHRAAWVAMRLFPVSGLPLSPDRRALLVEPALRAPVGGDGLGLQRDDASRILGPHQCLKLGAQEFESSLLFSCSREELADATHLWLETSPTRRAITMAGNRTPKEDRKVASILEAILTAKTSPKPTVVSDARLKYMKYA